MTTTDDRPKARSMGSHQSASMISDTWLTPPHIIEALGPFDLDPCYAPDPKPWHTALAHYTLPTDGLVEPWFGRVWLNPPYSRGSARHGHGAGLRPHGDVLVPRSCSFTDGCTSTTRTAHEPRPTLVPRPAWSPTEVPMPTRSAPPGLQGRSYASARTDIGGGQMTIRTYREYAPAYRADNGNVCIIGTSTTVLREYAERDDSTAWKLRYAPQTLTREDQMYAASVMSAYGYLMCEMTARDRQSVVSEIRRMLKHRLT